MNKKLIFMMLIMTTCAIKICAQQSLEWEKTRIMTATKAGIYSAETMQDIAGTDFVIIEKDISESSKEVTCTYRDNYGVKRLFGPVLIHLTDYSLDDMGNLVKLEYEGIIVADSNGTTNDISYTIKGNVISFINYDTEFCCALLGIKIIADNELCDFTDSSHLLMSRYF